MVHALAYPGALQALHFLIHWPALDHAVQLVTDRTGELDGNHYEILTPPSLGRGVRVIECCLWAQARAIRSGATERVPPSSPMPPAGRGGAKDVRSYPEFRYL
ncbi:DUF6880 family protein [Thiosulfatihalobacter marinus]|uniref:DUF6880 family protein n=1 Tax=Thiosulfatihalobacter marinus TaxID=2792481 RepID=UPI0039EE3097